MRSELRFLVQNILSKLKGKNLISSQEQAQNDNLVLLIALQLE